MARRTWWKVGALLAAMMMVFLTMPPATALAAEGDTPPDTLIVGGTDVKNGGYWTTGTDGKLTSGSERSWNVRYDASNNTLTLNGATITGASSENTNYNTVGIYAGSSGDVSLEIKLQGENTITSGGYGIWVCSPDQGGAATLNITGENDGNLNASGSGNSGIQVQSNSGNATLSIKNAKVTATSSYNAGVVIQSSDGSDVSLTVDGGNLTATGSGVSRGGIEFQFGTGEAGSGTPSLNVSNSAIVKASGDTGGITSNSSPVTPSGTGIVFNNGTGTVNGDVTLQEDLAIGEGESLNIPGGASMTIPRGTTLTNEGTVTNSGTLTNNGTINNSGTLPDNIKGTVPPSITTTSLDGGTVGAEYGATLGASGNPTLWEIAEDTLPNGLTLNESTGEISGAPTADGTFNFTVKATNGGGSDSKRLSITIIGAAALSITTQPRNQSVTEGQTASFSVAATGSGTLAYQWQQSTDSGESWTDISSATGSSYTTQATTAAMSGYQYCCVVTDGNNNSVTSQAATLTVTAATVPVSGVTLSQTQAHLYYNGTPNTLALTATVAPDNATNKAVAWTSSNSAVATVDDSGNVTAVAPGTAAITVTTSDGDKTATCLVTVTGVYIPPRPTGPDWDDVADDIADAEPGSTVTVDMDGKTVLPGEVLDELASLDVTLALDMGDGLIWEIYGGDVPADAEYDDVDLDVALGGDDIPADVVNLVTGESGSVQVSLEHDGPFGFELTLVAPLGEDAAGLVANLYRYDDEAGSLGYEASAQVDGEGVARLPFDHASSWLVALDSRSHALPFPDALEGEWYSEAVRWAWLGGIMRGNGDGTLRPADALTRSQMACLLHNAAGSPAAPSAGLPDDCEAGSWYAGAVSWALGAGVMNGHGDGSFAPGGALTREEAACVLMNAAELAGMDVSARADLSGFADAGDVSGWAREALSWAVAEGVMNGVGAGDGSLELQPARPCTRAEAAALLMNLARSAG